MVPAEGDIRCRCWRLRRGDGEAADDQTTDVEIIVEGRWDPSAKIITSSRFFAVVQFRSHEKKITKKKNKQTIKKYEWRVRDPDA